MVSRSRVVVLIDMDCFYCQVEEKLNPELKGKPVAVVQYNTWQGGGIIAVNYPARDEGVTRHMRGFEAKKKCPSINLVSVPEVRGKADLTKYRDAGKEVAAVLATFTPLLQRASVDEAYLDITEQVDKRISAITDLTTENFKNTHVVGSELADFLHNVITNKEFMFSSLRLAVGGLITEEIRYEVFNKTGYRCSAGIAHNKILAKLVCGLHKPNKQTILPQDAVEILFQTTKISKVTGFGGKFGQALSDDFQITFMGELAKISEKELQQKYDDKTAKWLYNIARGIDAEPVTPKLVSKSIACCKNFTGKAALATVEDVEHWIHELAAEMEERLGKDFKENNRKAKQMIVSFSQEISRKDVSSSRTHPLVSYSSRKIAQNALEIIKKYCQRSDGSFHIKFMGLSAGHFEDVSKVREITSFFQLGQANGVQKRKPNKETIEMYENVDSVYQQLTQELQENAQELIFYDDSFRVRQCSDNIPIACEDSTENSDNNSDTTEIQQPPTSFFAKYFVNSDSSNDNAMQISEEEADIDINGDEEVQNSGEILFEICSECQKKIPSAELPSHMDYHFALKLSKTQVTSGKANTASENHKKGKRGKRKAETNNGNSLLTFFNKTEANDESSKTEVCVECNKKIKIEEVSCHMDYHIAKKLHREINAVNIIAERPNVNPSKKKLDKGRTPSCKSIISFFKPS